MESESNVVIDDESDESEFYQDVESLIFRAGEIYAESETLTHEILAALVDIFGQVSIDAIDYIDGNNVTEFIAKDSGRNFFKVPDKLEIGFVILPNINFCACMSHAVDLPEDIDASESASEAYFKQKETEVDDCDEDPVEDICKHILAARLAESFDRAMTKYNEASTSGANYLDDRRKATSGGKFCLKKRLVEEDLFIEILEGGSSKIEETI